MKKITIAFMLLVAATQASIVTFIPPISHYHTQDTLGQYSFGYSGGPSAKHETRTLDGITQGSYAYVDANNILQTVSYVSDSINGFRVAATNLPQQPAFIAPLIAPLAQIEPKLEPATENKPVEPTTEVKTLPTIPEDTDEVKAAREAHLKAHEIAKAAAEEHSRKRRSAILAPLTYIYTPVISHQYGVQDNLGQYTYGYSDNLSAKTESRSIAGITTGGYSYIDANGQLQTVNYIADALGFRVMASNLPEGPKNINTPALIVPIAPEDTPEVKAARKAHLEAVEDAKQKEAQSNESSDN